MSGFKKFADHPFGGWIINGISVVAFILVLKVIVSRIPDNGVPGSIKAGVNTI